MLWALQASRGHITIVTKPGVVLTHPIKLPRTLIRLARTPQSRIAKQGISYDCWLCSHTRWYAEVPRELHGWQLTCFLCIGLDPSTEHACFAAGLHDPHREPSPAPVRRAAGPEVPEWVRLCGAHADDAAAPCDEDAIQHAVGVLREARRHKKSKKKDRDKASKAGKVKRKHKQQRKHASIEA